MYDYNDKGEPLADDRAFGEKVADAIAKFGGSWKFIIAFSVILAFWILLNTLALFNWIAWDKQPYILLNLVLSFVAAFQAPFIMMSQNRAEKKQDAAYRRLFKEIKELVEEDIRIDKGNIENIETLSKQMDNAEGHCRFCKNETPPQR